MEDFSISDFNFSDSGAGDLLPSEFSVDSGGGAYDANFQGSSSLDFFGGASEIGSKVFDTLWGGLKSAGNAYNNMGADSKGLLASAVAGGANAWLQSRNADKEREYLSQMKKEDFDRLQNARRIPVDAPVATAARFK